MTLLYLCAVTVVHGRAVSVMGDRWTDHGVIDEDRSVESPVYGRIGRASAENAENSTVMEMRAWKRGAERARKEGGKRERDRERDRAKSLREGEREARMEITRKRGARPRGVKERAVARAGCRSI